MISHKTTCVSIDTHTVPQRHSLSLSISCDTIQFTSETIQVDTNSTQCDGKLEFVCATMKKLNWNPQSRTHDVRIRNILNGKTTAKKYFFICFDRLLATTEQFNGTHDITTAAFSDGDGGGGSASASDSVGSQTYVNSFHSNHSTFDSCIFIYILYSASPHRRYAHSFRGILIFISLYDSLRFCFHIVCVI